MQCRPHVCLFDAVLYSGNPAGIHLRGRPRRGGRAAECGGLLNRCRGQNSYRGFESPPLRQMFQRLRLGERMVGVRFAGSHFQRVSAPNPPHDFLPCSDLLLKRAPFTRPECGSIGRGICWRGQPWFRTATRWVKSCVFLLLPRGNSFP